MASRSVDAPEKAYLTKEDAATWLSWSVSTFERAVAEQSDWCRPAGIRGERGALLWPWRSIVTLQYIYDLKLLGGDEEDAVELEKPPGKASKREKSKKIPDAGQTPAS